MKKKLFVLLFAFLIPFAMMGQKVGVKTNLLHWATVTPNLSLEVALGKNVTMDLYGAYNNFQIMKDNVKWKHWLVQPEVRIWTCESFNGFFFGIHGMTGQFNMGKLKLPPLAYTFQNNILENLPTRRYEGWYAGAGISVGYQWVLGNHWNIELSLGAGYNHIWYREFEGQRCGPKLSEGESNYIGPTKATLSFVYFFK